MIAKHVPMRSVGKSDFAGLVRYITDAQSKDHRLGHVQVTNCDAYSVRDTITEVLATQYANTRAESDKTYHLIVSFRAGEQPSADTLKAIEEQGRPRPGHAPIVDNITKKGTIIYRAGLSAVRDDGDRLQVSREADRDGVQAALRLAMERYGERITISMVWTFGMLALRKADIGDFFAEFVRFTIFTGFFWWLLTNGPNFASSIYASLRQLAEGAIGISGISPSGIVNVGFAVWKQALTNLSAWQPIDSLVGLALSAGILLLLATIGINMLLLLVSGWILAYAGIFFLGFGGSRWTSDMAINYYKTVLGVAAQLMTMVLLVGIGNDLLSSFYGQMTKGALNFDELGVMLVFCLALLMLINRVPPLVAGIINGTGVGAAGGIGNFGAGAVAGAALGAAGMAAAAAGKAGAALLGGAANMAGGVSAVKAAFEKAQGSMSGESSMSSMPSMGGSGGGSSSGGGDSGGGSPFAQAAGFGSSGSSSTSTGTKANKSEGGNAKGKSAGSTQGSQAKSASENKPQGASSGGGLAQAAAVTASAAGELAKGAGSVLKNKAAQLAEGFQERVSQTPGGQIASAIRASVQSQDAPAFDGNSLGSDRQADPSDEVAAFVNRSADESSEGSDTVQRQAAGPTFNPRSAFDY